MAREDISLFIKNRLAELDISTTELARRAGLSRQALYKMLRGEVEQSKVFTFIRLAAALESHPQELMRVLLRGSGLIAERRPSPARKSKPVLEAPARGKYAGDNTGFIADVTIPDYSLVMIGSTFDKTWKIINIGSVVWENRRLRCVDELLEIRLATPESSVFAPPKPTGLAPLQSEIPIPLTLPGQEVALTVRFHAPLVPGSHASYWKMVDAAGDLCFPHLEGVRCVVNVALV